MAVLLRLDAVMAQPPATTRERSPVCRHRWRTPSAVSAAQLRRDRGGRRGFTHADQAEGGRAQEEGQRVQQGDGGPAHKGEQARADQGADQAGALDRGPDQAVEVPAQFARNGGGDQCGLGGVHEHGSRAHRGQHGEEQPDVPRGAHGER
ncbi:hypothetical protein GCM10010406_22270 [Streptomyces thermolineatus]|uniref:Uncharacterized protein n=1 Tax=Streptomyces thermolineatus TaxID=44033 RepID=A0ABP5YXT4_9ACTN